MNSRSLGIQIKSDIRSSIIPRLLNKLTETMADDTKNIDKDCNVEFSHIEESSDGLGRTVQIISSSENVKKYVDDVVRNPENIIRDA